jgi:hypothetical protein
MRAGANRSGWFNAAVSACRDVRRTRQPGETGSSGFDGNHSSGFKINGSLNSNCKLPAKNESQLLI